MPCLSDIPGRPTLIQREMEKEWFWGRGEVLWGTGKSGEMGSCGQDAIK